MRCMRYLSFTRAAWLGFCMTSVLCPAVAEETAGHSRFRWSLVGREVGPTGAQFGHSDPNDIPIRREGDCSSLRVRSL